MALATLLARPLRVASIRVARPKPGLRRQHLTAALACAAICRGSVEGAEVGSQEIVFHPGPRVIPGEYSFDVGSAGATTLLAFTLLIPSLFAEGPLKFTLTGGVYQDFAPSAFHMSQCLAPLLERMGARVSLRVDRPGYVPKGQGRLIMEVTPCAGPLRPLTLLDQGRTTLVKGASLASHLADRHVAERMAAACRDALKREGLRAEIETMEDKTALQKGAVLAVWTGTATGALLGADMAAAVGRASEKIGQSVASALLEDLGTGAAVDRHIADQLIIFAALADGVTTYRIPGVTDHVDSNLWLVEEILGASSKVEGHRISIEGLGFAHSKTSHNETLARREQEG